jgi:hypothetical protein
VTLVTTWAFGAHGLLRIFAQPFAENRGSRRVLEKAGYALEGTMRRSAVKDGGVARPVPVRPPLRVLRACGPCRSALPGRGDDVPESRSARQGQGAGYIVEGAVELPKN